MDTEPLFITLCATLDADESLLEILLPYLESLLAIGIDFNNPDLQEAIEAHITHLEAACQAILGYAGELAHRHSSFENDHQATHYLIQALSTPWHPHPDWNQSLALIAQSRYQSPYETGLRLIYQINRHNPPVPLSLTSLDPLSDTQIEALLPSLKQQLANLLQPTSQPFA
jgi:hypothetical protein